MLFQILVLPVYLIHTRFVARGRALHGVFMREMTCMRYLEEILRVAVLRRVGKLGAEAHPQKIMQHWR